MNKTITSIFILPTLKINRNELKENNFINAYLNENISDHNFTECIYLLFKPVNASKFRKFVNKEYESERGILFDYDLEKGFTVLVYRLDPIFKNDFELIKDSKYSETSKFYQNVFPKYVEIFNKNSGKTTNELSLQYRIFNKNVDLKKYFIERKELDFTSPDFELWYNFESEKETLKLEDLMKFIYEKTE